MPVRLRPRVPFRHLVCTLAEGRVPEQGEQTKVMRLVLMDSTPAQSGRYRFDSCSVVGHDANARRVYILKM